MDRADSMSDLSLGIIMMASFTGSFCDSILCPAAAGFLPFPGRLRG